MNAATVIGPRSRTKSAIRNPRSASALFLAHGHEYFVVAAPDAQLREVAGLNLLQLALGVERARDGPAVDRQNDVPLPQAARRRTVGVDVGDHRAGLSGRNPQPPLQRRRQVFERESEAARAVRLGLLLIAA